MINKKPNYYSEINYLRGFAIFSVISIHISTYFTKMTSVNYLALIYMVIDAVSHFAVPAFIFISGFVLHNSYTKQYKIDHYYIKRIKSVLPQYFICSTLYLLVAFYGSKLIGKSFNLNVSDLIFIYLTGNAFYHLWFFILIIELYFFFPLLLNLFTYFDAKNKSILFLAVFFTLGVLYNSISGNFSTLFKTSTQFIGYLFYFILGMIINSNYQFINLKSFLENNKFLVSIILLLGTFLIVLDYLREYFSYHLFFSYSNFEQVWKILFNFISMFYFTIIILILMYISIFLSKSKIFPFINKIGSYSFAIYLLHALVLYAIVLVFSKFDFNWSNLLFYPFTLLLTLFFTISLIEMCKKIPYSRYFIGKIE